MLKIGILGGTFDPVHNEHINLCLAAKRELDLDKVILMPTKISPHKQGKRVAKDSDRLNMLNLAVEGLSGIEVSDYEIKRGGNSYTYLTIEEFAKNGDELYFIVGADMLKDFKTWRYPERILDKAKLVCFSRDGEAVDFEAERDYFKSVLNKDFIKLDYVGKNVSSTKSRVYSVFGLKPEGLNDKVYEYIKNNAVYPAPPYIKTLKENLTEKRYIHTANVVVAGMQQAKNLKLDEDSVFTACALHDVAKYLEKEDFPDANIPSDVPKSVVHAFLGAYYIEAVLKIKDEDIINAVRYHTSGRAKMSELEKLVYCADMVEEGRSYDGVEYLRELYKKDFALCFLECLREEKIHLINKGKPIYVETLNACKYYLGD